MPVGERPQQPLQLDRIRVGERRAGKRRGTENRRADAQVDLGESLRRSQPPSPDLSPSRSTARCLAAAGLRAGWITGSPFARGVSRLARLDDRAVHAVGDLVRELDADVSRTRRPRARPRTRPSRARRRCSRRSCRARRAPRGESRSSATTSLIPIRPPGLSTRAISVSTAGLSTERLITQFEITTSTESAGSGICSITPFRKWTFATPASARVLLREREHLVGHVEPVGDARSGRRAWPTGSRRSRRRSRGRAPSRPRAARRPRSGCRSRARRARPRRAARRAARRRRAPRRTSPRRSRRRRSRSRCRSRSRRLLRDRARRLRVAAPHLLAQLVSRRGHQQHTPFRSATAASFSTASRFNEK